MIGPLEKLQCLRREIAIRKAVYPKWVASGKMTRQAADHEIEVMEAIAADYSPDLGMR